MGRGYYMLIIKKLCDEVIECCEYIIGNNVISVYVKCLLFIGVEFVVVLLWLEFLKFFLCLVMEIVL